MEPNVNVVVEKVKREPSEDSRPEIKCTIEGGGEGPFRLYFPEDSTEEDISKALRHKALFLVDDLSRLIPADKRQRIIELHEEAADNVPSFRERK